MNPAGLHAPVKARIFLLLAPIRLMVRRLCRN
jgi:hypothetical protein